MQSLRLDYELQGAVLSLFWPPTKTWNETARAAPFISPKGAA
jgi:hypothetical protein